MIPISVVICTYNRVDVLSDTLQSWLSVDNTGVEAELIIIDNNSSDHTAHIVEAFSANWSGQLRYFSETKIGLSNARNRAIHEVSNDILAFVDDDVFFDKNWLTEICAAFESHPDVVCVGGKSIPTFDTPPPDWVTEEIYSFYGSTRTGDADRMMTFPEHPFGLNMAFRKSVFDRVGDFNPQLGRSKGCLLSNEELDIFYRIAKADLNVFYASNALLYHRIPPERTEKRWIIERTYWQGVSDVVYWQIVNPRKKIHLAMKALWLLRTIIYFYIKNMLRRFFPKRITVHSFKETLAVYRTMGIARQSLVEALSLRKC